jgi:hypothetical protein
VFLACSMPNYGLSWPVPSSVYGTRPEHARTQARSPHQEIGRTLSLIEASYAACSAGSDWKDRRMVAAAR